MTHQHHILCASIFEGTWEVVTYAKEDSKLKSQSCRRLSRASSDAMRRRRIARRTQHQRHSSSSLLRSICKYSETILKNQAEEPFITFSSLTEAAAATTKLRIQHVQNTTRIFLFFRFCNSKFMTFLRVYEDYIFGLFWGISQVYWVIPFTYSAFKLILKVLNLSDNIKLSFFAGHLKRSVRLLDEC